MLLFMFSGMIKFIIKLTVGYVKKWKYLHL